MKENIILIGFMGAGKTTVGRMVANELTYTFLDTDQMIEDRAGKSINEIFAEDGEEAFRKMESELLEELNEKTSCAVICTGGGLPMREENASRLKELGVVMYLKVTEDVVVKRLKGDTTRPLLADDDMEEKIMKLLTVRHPRYQAACHMEIDAGIATKKQVANSIISHFCKILNH